MMTLDSGNILLKPSHRRQLFSSLRRATHLGDRIGALKFFDDARAEFANIQKQSAYALKIMPRHRDLIEQVRQHGFMPKTAA